MKAQLVQAVLVMILFGLTKVVVAENMQSHHLSKMVKTEEPRVTEYSDEKLVAPYVVSTTLGEYTHPKLAKIKKTAIPLPVYRTYYNMLSTVSKQGAASEYEPRKDIKPIGLA